MFELQRDLDQMAEQWNTHNIRPTKNQNVPNGRPMLMYSLPELFGAVNHLCNVDGDQIEICEGESCMEPMKCDDTIEELCNLILSRHQIHKPLLGDDLYELYLYLRTELTTLLAL